MAAIGQVAHLGIRGGRACNGSYLPDLAPWAPDSGIRRGAPASRNDKRPVETKHPKNALPNHGCQRTSSIDLISVSTKEIKNVQAKQHSFINAHGEETDLIGMQFRLGTDRANNLASHNHRQSLDLAAGDGQRVDIVTLNEGDEAAGIVMLYASQTGVGLGNLIPLKFLPQDLVVRVTADGLASPIDKAFKIYVDRNRILKMVRIS